MDDNDKAIKRIVRPSHVVNWARNNVRRLDDTRRLLLRFALNPPHHSLGPVYAICRRIACLHIDLDQALKEAENIKHSVTQKSAREIIPIFHQYVTSNGLDGLDGFDDTFIPYPIGRDPDGTTITIPVRSTFTTVEGGKLKPYFLIGWTKLAYDEYQKQLLSTIICRSVLTQQDYLKSDAQIVCIPRGKWSKARSIREWSARSYGTLSDADLQDQFDRYTIAVAEIISELRSE